MDEKNKLSIGKVLMMLVLGLGAVGAAMVVSQAIFPTIHLPDMTGDSVSITVASTSQGQVNPDGSVYTGNLKPGDSFSVVYNITNANSNGKGPQWMVVAISDREHDMANNPAEFAIKFNGEDAGQVCATLDGRLLLYSPHQYSFGSGETSVALDTTINPHFRGTGIDMNPSLVDSKATMDGNGITCE